MALIATGDPLYLSFEDRLLYFMRNCRQIHLSELCRKLQVVDQDQLEVAIRELAAMCWVVQGCLVLKSSIVYDRNWRIGMAVPSATTAPSSSASSARPRGTVDRVQLGREYLLTQFHQRRIIYRDEVNALLQLELEPLEELLNELATKNTEEDEQVQARGIPKGGQWEFKISTDNTLQQQ